MVGTSSDLIPNTNMEVKDTHEEKTHSLKLLPQATVALRQRRALQTDVVSGPISTAILAQFFAATDTWAAIALAKSRNKK